MGICGGKGEKNQPLLPDMGQVDQILEIEQQLVSKQEQVKLYDQQYLAIQNEFQQHLLTYPQYVQQQLDEQQTLEQDKLYLSNLINPTKIKHNQIIQGVENLQTINTKFKYLQKPEKIKEKTNFNTIKDEGKESELRQKIIQQNEAIRQLNGKHVKFQKEISERLQTDQQNKQEIEEFQRQVQQKLDAVSKKLDIIVKFNELKVEVEEQSKNIQKDESPQQQFQQLNLEEWAVQKQNRIQQSKEFVEQQKKTLEKNSKKFEELKKQIEDNQVGIPYEISNLDQTLKHLKATLEKKETDIKAEELVQINQDNPIQQELLRLLNFGDQFQGIDDAFQQVQKGVFQKLQTDLVEIIRIAKLCEGT